MKNSNTLQKLWVSVLTNMGTTHSFAVGGGGERGGTDGQMEEG